MCALGIAAFSVGAQDQKAADRAGHFASQLIESVIKSGTKPKVMMTVLGARKNYRILGADAKALRVDVQGNTFPLQWRDIPAADFVGVMVEIAGHKGEWVIAASRVALALGYPRRASEILTRIRDLDDRLKPELRALYKEISEAEGRAREAIAAAAAAARKRAAKKATMASAAPRPSRNTVPPAATGKAALAGRSGGVLRVGPNRQYKTVAAAARAAKSGDRVEIDAGRYPGGVATWNVDDILIRGVGGMAHMDADGRNQDGKAIWVVRGRNVVIENIEFSGCRVPHRNGAGIRLECRSLTIRNCYFHDNENGLLGGKDSDILIEYTEFARNGAGDGYSHNLYIGRARSLTMRFCYCHGTPVGHNLKSRAARNVIMYCRIMDESEGNSSYTVDLPNGGLSFVIGNLIQKGPRSKNNTLLTYAEEGASNPDQRLFVINNTMVNDQNRGTFVSVRGGAEAVVSNNLFIGGGRPLRGSAKQSNNLATRDSKVIVNRANYDYRLAKDSPARGKGVNPGKVDGFDLAPVWQYVHKTRGAPRVNPNALDIGAYAYGFDPKARKKPVEVAKAKPKKPAVPSKPQAKPKREPLPPPRKRTPDQICRSWFTMAMNYKKAKFRGNALSYLNRIIKTYPDTKWAEKARVELASLGG